jgi:hypothetical protein
VQTDTNARHQKGSISSTESERTQLDQWTGRKRFPFKIEYEVNELEKEVLICGFVVVRPPCQSVRYLRPLMSKNQVVATNEGNFF